jgi:uroporphyrinogen decarboxylase
MSPRERVQCTLAGELPDRVSYFEVSVDYPWLCRLLGRALAGDENFESGEYRTNDIEDQLRLNEILHRDNLVYCHLPPIPAVKSPGRDQILFFHDGRIKTWEDVEAFQLPDLDTEEAKRPLREFIEICHANDYASVVHTRCGISATYLSMGFEHFFLQLVDDSDMVEALMRKYAEWTARNVPVFAEIGFDVIWTSDDVAGKNGPLFSPEMYRERFWPHVRKISDAIKATGMKWGFHSDGDVRELLDDLVDLGIDILNPIEPACLDILELKERFKGHPKMVGNVDVDDLSRGTIEKVQEDVFYLLKNVAPEGNYFLASGNSIASYTRVENVRAMCDTNREYGRYPIDPARLG